MLLSLLAVAGALLGPGEDEPHAVEPDTFPIAPGVTRGGRVPITFEVVYRVGPAGLDAGGSVAVGFGYTTGNVANPAYAALGGYLVGPGSALRQFPLVDPQIADPAGDDYVSATCSRADVEVSLGTQMVQFKTTLIRGRVDGALVEGDEIRFLFGDTSQGSSGFGSRGIEGEPEVVFFVDRRGRGKVLLDPGPFPRLRFVPAVVDNMRLSLPMTAGAGEQGLLTLTVCQGADGPYDRLLPVVDFEGKVELEWATDAGVEGEGVEHGGAGTELPASVEFHPSDKGTVRVPVRFGSPGHAVIRARLASDPEVSALSNVTVLGALPFDYAVGDNHRHCAEGGHAAGTAERIWQAQYDTGDDYATVLQHVAYEGADWEYSNARAREFQARVDPEEELFIAFPGYEWSLPGNHHHVVFQAFGDDRLFAPRRPGGSGPVKPRIQKSVKGLLGSLRERGGAIAIPHHSQWLDSADVPFEWGARGRDPVRPVVEIYSNHGASDCDYELPPKRWEYPVHWDGTGSEQRPKSHGGSVRNALATGRHLSFVGGSDNHGWARGPSPSRPGKLPSRNSRGGLGVVLGDPETPLLRERVFAGLLAGRTYATTGHKSVALFQCADAVMGETAIVAPGTPLRVFAVASGVARPDRARFERIRIVRDGALNILDRTIDSEVLELTWADPAPPRDGAAHAYHVELYHDDLHITWLSPIWVTYQDRK